VALIKTTDEINLLKRAAKATESVFARALPYIRARAPGLLRLPGSSGLSELSEIEIAEMMESFALKIPGVEGLAFPTIIASGPNGAMPHAEPTERVIKTGDLVTVDFGVMLGGYASDMTRTLILGEPDETLRKAFDSVLRAQAAGLAAAKAGMACADLDAVCRDIIENDGFGEYFVHTTGHGIGTEVHEDPRIAKNSEVTLEAGMAVTIEPGIYIEGLGGVRIEDTVIITETGCEVITSGIPKIGGRSDFVTF